MDFDNKLVEKLKNEGNAVVPNLISQDDLATYKNIINKHKAFSKSLTFTIPVSKTYLAVKLFKLQIDKIIYTLKLMKMANNLNLKSCSDKVFEEKTKLYVIDLYMSQKSNNPILPWHCDQSYIGKTVTKQTHPNEGYLKFFFYLTDVDSNNGCLGYIPKSHILTYYLKICFYNKELQYEPFFTLIDIRKLLKKEYVKDKLKKYINNETIDEFLHNTNFAEEGNNDTYKHDVKVNAGDVLIFNELGYHRGASPTKNDRYALRYHYLRQSHDVNWYKKIKQ
tara:strand:+ start:388 stop:1224 length:837 start_codon:yes stop_codon:yes gene_type:complete